MAISTDLPIALVSGANRGIGHAVATILASKHQYYVIVGSRDLAAGQKVAAELKNAGHAASAVQLDLSSPESIKSAVDTITEDFGRLEVLINNAGILIDTTLDGSKPKPDTLDLFQQTFTTNVIGTALLTESLIPLLRKSSNARIVFVSSAMGSLQLSTDPSVPWYNLDCKAYDASKAALNVLMINYARILVKDGIKVNSACPGLVSTGLTSYTEHGVSPEVGATRIVELATMGPDGPTGTYSNKDGPLPW